jgi:Ca2+/Na+ antiporter
VTTDTDSHEPSTAAAGSSVPERAAAIADERPEVAVGAAFGGGLLLALILKRLAR